MILIKQRTTLNNYKIKLQLGQFLIVAGIMLCLTSCQHLRNVPETSGSDGEAIWIGNKGEQPMNVWPTRPYVICDRTVYRCEKL